MKKILFLILLFIPIAMLGQAGKLFTADSQLSSSLINKVYQDANGMIWIATEDGLNRYDGAKFTTYRHEDGNPHSLSHNYVRTIFSDSHGRIFRGTYSGLQMYDIAADCFSELATWPDGKTYQANVIDMTERHNGEIWISGGLLVTFHMNNTAPTLGKPLNRWRPMKTHISCSQKQAQESVKHLGTLRLPVFGQKKTMEAFGYQPIQRISNGKLIMS